MSIYTHTHTCACHHVSHAAQQQRGRTIFFHDEPNIRQFWAQRRKGSIHEGKGGSGSGGSVVMCQGFSHDSRHTCVCARACVCLCGMYRQAGRWIVLFFCPPFFPPPPPTHSACIQHTNDRMRRCESHGVRSVKRNFW